MSSRIAMDIGGTFTDVVTYDSHSHRMDAGKVLTTSSDLAVGVFDALDRVDVSFADVEFFVHGTTQGLNALLERRGARAMLVTTAGFRDVYQIGRGNRDRLFDLHYRKPLPLIRRDAIVEVGGRMDSRGQEVTALDEESVYLAAKRARQGGYSAVAVSLLFSHLNGDHERRVRQILREELGDDIMIVLSHEVASEWREYERTSTAVMEAYTGPSVHRYLDQVERRFDQKGLRVPVHVMQSSGGLVNADFARRHPLQTLLSGPVGGTMGGVAVSRLLDEPNIICIDMGGTSFDVSLVVDHEPDLSADGQAEGFPVLMPLVNLHTIGAGGGSIAYAQADGLRVGPQSAGAEPGPACYDRGGRAPTVTDANLLLGRIDPASFAGGSIPLNKDAARQAVSSLAETLGMGAVELASGICDVSNAKMAQAIRTLTVEQGREPGQFALLAFGGAGPMHAAFIAHEIGIPKVVVPRFAGVFSAWGMLEADVRRDFTVPFFASGSDVDTAALASSIADLSARANAALREQAVPSNARTITHSLDMRYESQDFALAVPILPSDTIDSAGFMPALEERFAQAHYARYGHTAPGAPIQVVAIRTSGRGAIEKMNPERPVPEGASPERVTRDVIFDGTATPTVIIARSDLPVGADVPGPAIVHEETCTTVVPPAAHLHVDEQGFLIITIPVRPELRMEGQA